MMGQGKQPWLCDLPLFSLLMERMDQGFLRADVLGSLWLIEPGLFLIRLTCTVMEGESLSQNVVICYGSCYLQCVCLSLSSALTQRDSK